MSTSSEALKAPDQRSIFVTTHWSVVLKAGRSDAPQAQDALEKLCQTYWHPLYAYVRRRGHSPADAEDLTQAFFARPWTNAKELRTKTNKPRHGCRIRKNTQFVTLIGNDIVSSEAVPGTSTQFVLIPTVTGFVCACKIHPV